MAFSTLVGLLVDAFKHSTDPQVKSFWTPWHGLFYSGFLATAVWPVLLTLRRKPVPLGFWSRRHPGTYPPWSGSSYLPQAGFGDAIWHTVFGVETSLDALLSPTHLLLFVGLLMIVSAPLWAAWADPTTGPGHRELAPAVASLGLTTTLVAFFFEYA